METCDERRKRKLGELAAAHGLDSLAEAAGLKGPESLDQILKGTLLPPRKSDGMQNARSLGDDTARKIEKALGLERGWFDEDWPFPMVDRSLWDACDEQARGFVQHALLLALKERSAGKPLPIVQMHAVQPTLPSGHVAHSPASPKGLTADVAQTVGTVEGGSNVSNKTGRIQGKEHGGRTPRPAGKGRKR
jgi:hypothetical protein